MSAIRVARGFTGSADRREVRRQLPRPRRPAARRGGSGLAALGSPGRPASPRAPCATRASFRTTSCPSSTTHGVRHRRAGRRQHGPRRAGARLPRGPAPSATASALLVFDEVITGFRWRAAAPRREPRSHPTSHVRQGHRRRPADRCLRRPARRDVGRGAARPRVPGRHACRGTRSRRRPGSPRSTCSTSLRPTRSWRRPRSARRRARPRPSPDAGVGALAPVESTLVGLFFGADAPTDYAGAKRTDEAALRHRSSTRCSTRASRSRPARTRCCSPASPTPTRSSTRSSPQSARRPTCRQRSGVDNGGDRSHL